MDGLKTSRKPWISICTVLLPNPNLLQKHLQSPRRSWAGATFTSMWKRWSSACWWPGRSSTTSTVRSASTSGTTRPAWGTYPSASSRLPKLLDGRFWIRQLRPLTSKTQSWFQICHPSSRAHLSPPAQPLWTSRSSSSKMWWWWPNSTAGSNTREPTGPRRPSPACTTRVRPATQKTPSPRQPGSVPNPLRLYASSSPSPAPITGWCRKSVRTTTFRRSRTSSTLDDGFWNTKTEMWNFDFSYILQNHAFSLCSWLSVFYMLLQTYNFQHVSQCSLSPYACVNVLTAKTKPLGLKKISQRGSAKNCNSSNGHLRLAPEDHMVK